MTLARTVVVPGMTAEYAAFADLVGGLSDEQWEAPSRCEGWRVAEVAAHVIGQLTDVTNLRLDGLGTPEVTKRQVEERRGRGPKELAEELTTGGATASAMAGAFDDEAWAAPGPPGVTGTLGFGLEALWFDTYLHADDIRAALGMPTERGPGIEPSLSHIAQVLTDQGWRPATLELDGYAPFAISGGGPAITGDPVEFILASTGRSDPASLGLDPTVNIYR
jgi:uncharacterized protein (TIGR03083 family)